MRRSVARAPLGFLRPDAVRALRRVIPASPAPPRLSRISRLHSPVPGRPVFEYGPEYLHPQVMSTSAAELRRSWILSSLIAVPARGISPAKIHASSTSTPGSSESLRLLLSGASPTLLDPLGRTPSNEVPMFHALRMHLLLPSGSSPASSTLFRVRLRWCAPPAVQVSPLFCPSILGLDTGSTGSPASRVGFPRPLLDLQPSGTLWGDNPCARCDLSPLPVAPPPCLGGSVRLSGTRSSRALVVWLESWWDARRVEKTSRPSAVGLPMLPSLFPLACGTAMS